jgi:arabinofuranosyltransferase
VADGRRRALLVVAAFGLGALVHWLYIVRVGGDFMEARLLLPGLFAIAAPVAVVSVSRRVATYVCAALVLPWAVIAIASLRSYTDRNHVSRVTVDDYGWGDGQGGRGWFTGPGLYYANVRLPAPPPADRPAAVAAFGIGLPGYALGPDVYIVDLLGLADPFTAHLELRERGVVPGHEKRLPPPWFVARYTDGGEVVDEALLPGGRYGINTLDVDPQGSFEERVAAARRALRCPKLRELERSYTRRLTPDRFADNLVDALRWYGFRTPPEPADAVAELC